MKPLNLIALLLFLGGLVWTLTRSERSVREIQCAYYSVIAPFLKAGSAMETKAREFLNETKHSKELEAELTTVHAEVGRLRLIESRFQELENDNHALRTALGFKTRPEFHVVAAQVIRRNPSTWWQTVEIDRGQECGIGTQDAVISNDGLVGKVDHSEAGRSEVILLTDEACKVSAKVEGTPEVGILNGQRGQPDGLPTLCLRFLSHDAVIRTGSRVFTSGRGGIFPTDVLLGTVEKVEKGALDSEAIIRPSVNFADLGIVFVHTTKK